MGHVQAGTDLPVCVDGLAECQIYSASLCGLMMGLSPAHGATAAWPDGNPTTLDLPIKLFADLVSMGPGGNAYNSYYYSACGEVGFDYGYLTSCARSPATLPKLAAKFKRAAALGMMPASTGDAAASIFVDGVQVKDWQTRGALCGAVCNAYAGTAPEEVCSHCATGANATDGAGAGAEAPEVKHGPRPVATRRSSLVAVTNASTAAATEVKIALYCTGDMLTLHSVCAQLIIEAERDVLPLFNGEVEVEVIPSGSIAELPGPDGSTLPTPVCAGGWAECELHAYAICAASSLPGGSWVGCYGCLYWAAHPEGGGRGMFYNGGLAPVDMCMHKHCSDRNWGDMTQCALGLSSSFGVPQPRHGVAYTELLRLFALGAEAGVTLGAPKITINGRESRWPDYPASTGPEGSLLGEVCAAFAKSPPPCEAVLADALT